LRRFIELTPEHLRETEWGGRPAYHHQVRSHVSNLCQPADLRRVSRGQYEITSRGRDRISRHAA
jgi:hypothetical protein